MKNEAENAKQIPHSYNIGDKLLIRRGTENKYEAPCEGPYTTTKVNDDWYRSFKGQQC
jgi:hypothetical protein